MDTDMISGGGTNIAAALRLAMDSFKRSSSADKVILIISDGEEHDSASQSVLKNISDDRLRIYTVGVGTEKGGLVPVYEDSGNNNDGSYGSVAVVDYMKDSNGNPVTSRLDAETMGRIAQDGNGSYYQATSHGTEVISLLDELAKLRRDVLAEDQIQRFKPMYQYFLGAGILFLLLAWLLPEGWGGAA